MSYYYTILHSPTCSHEMSWALPRLCAALSCQGLFGTCPAWLDPESTQDTAVEMPSHLPGSTSNQTRRDENPPTKTSMIFQMPRLGMFHWWHVFYDSVTSAESLNGLHKGCGQSGISAGFHHWNIWDSKTKKKWNLSGVSKKWSTQIQRGKKNIITHMIKSEDWKYVKPPARIAPKSPNSSPSPLTTNEPDPIGKRATGIF